LPADTGAVRNVCRCCRRVILLLGPPPLLQPPAPASPGTVQMNNRRFLCKFCAFYVTIIAVWVALLCSCIQSFVCNKDLPFASFFRRQDT
jgi:hypothetical protein